MPTGTTQASLQRLFSAFGNIESIRVLSFKNCAFINFEELNSAIFAREALVKNETVVKELWGVRVGFAKAPTKTTVSKPDNSQINHEMWTTMQQLGADSKDVELVTCKYSFVFIQCCLTVNFCRSLFVIVFRNYPSCS